jgi:hypothetical protein
MMLLIRMLNDDEGLEEGGVGLNKLINGAQKHDQPRHPPSKQKKDHLLQVGGAGSLRHSAVAVEVETAPHLLMSLQQPLGAMCHP